MEPGVMVQQYDGRFPESHYPMILQSRIHGQWNGSVITVKDAQPGILVVDVALLSRKLHCRRSGTKLYNYVHKGSRYPTSPRRSGPRSPRRRLGRSRAQRLTDREH
jgi:hypothetical protein